MKQEPKLETDYAKEDAINLVKSVFQSMGGNIMIRRPRHIDKYEILTIARDNFMMDFENACLSSHWDSSKRPHPKGPKRHEDQEWAAMIQSQVYPHHSDVDWEEYVDWVNIGGGDEYFQEDDEEEEDEPDVKTEKRQVIRDTRCSGCGRDDDFCRCGSGDSSLWWGG